MTINDDYNDKIDDYDTIGDYDDHDEFADYDCDGYDD